MAGSANFEDTTKPNQSPAAGGFDSERRSSGVSARWLLMQSIKSRRKRYEACDDVAGSANFEDRCRKLFSRKNIACKTLTSSKLRLL